MLKTANGTLSLSLRPLGEGDVRLPFKEDESWEVA